MDTIRVNVTGDRQVGIRFDEFPDELYDDLKAEISALTTELYGLIDAATPDRTGRLRSEERARVYSDKDRISGRVTIAGDSKDFAKAGALEYGAHRSTKVSAHQMRLDHVFGQKLSAPLMVLVDAYSRTPDIQEVAFERGPLGAMEPEIIARLNAVVERNVAKANA